MTSLRDRLRARRPIWAIYPTAGLAALVLATGALWLIPGIVGRIVGTTAAVVVVGLVSFDYLRLPRAKQVHAERKASETIGLGDAATLTYVLRTEWPWPTRVQLFDGFPPGIEGALPDKKLALAATSEQSVTVPITGQSRG